MFACFLFVIFFPLKGGPKFYKLRTPQDQDSPLNKGSYALTFFSNPFSFVIAGEKTHNI